MGRLLLEKAHEAFNNGDILPTGKPHDACLFAIVADAMQCLFFLHGKLDKLAR